MSRRIGQDPDSRMRRMSEWSLRGRERGNGGRVIGGRGTMERSEGSPADITSFGKSWNV